MPEDPPEAVSFETEFRGTDAATYAMPGRAGLRVPLDLLGGDTSETLFRSAISAGEEHGFRLFSARGLSFGCAVQPVDGRLEASTLDLYGRLLRATGGLSIYRVWNYLPDINQVSLGLEQYQAFSSGRARAFEAAFGPEYRRNLPAASAVGCRGGSIALAFVAGAQSPQYFENPEQIPAYDYPQKYGPHSPSFARATVAVQEGRPLIYLSGTSAVKGHDTVFPGSVGAQIECTLDNLRLISRAAGAGEDLGAALGYERQFKVYLRHRTDFPMAKARLDTGLFRRGDRVVWLQADLCRADLTIEVEASLAGRP